MEIQLNCSLFNNSRITAQRNGWISSQGTVNTQTSLRPKHFNLKCFQPKPRQLWRSFGPHRGGGGGRHFLGGAGGAEGPQRPVPLFCFVFLGGSVTCTGRPRRCRESQGAWSPWRKSAAHPDATRPEERTTQAGGAKPNRAKRAKAGPRRFHPIRKEGVFGRANRIRRRSKGAGRKEIVANHRDVTKIKCSLLN